MKWTAEQLPDLTGSVAIVTGANSGIGLHAARGLAEHGARVVLACRDTRAGQAAVERLRAAARGIEVEVAELDLASMTSIRSFGRAWDGPLDLLVNNAGVMAPPKLTTTLDGFELQFGTNHLRHFVLTGLLLPALLAAPAPRVVTVSSIAHRSGTEAVLDGNVGIGYDPQKTYANSKLANLLFARELQHEAETRGLRLVSTAAHPGLSATGLAADPQGMGANRAVRTMAPTVLKIFTQSATAGARATLYAATVAAPGSYTGPGWLGETRGPIGPARPAPLGRDEKLARRLWQASEAFTGYRYPWPGSQGGAD